MAASAPRPPPRLLVCTSGRLAEDPDAWWQHLEAALSAADPRVTIWLREHAPGAPLLAAARRLARACAAAGARLVISGRLDLALAVGPRVGVHLPALGLPPGRVRPYLGPEALLGRSCHALGELEPLRGRVDYVTLSPIWASPSKPESPPLGLQSLSRAAATLPVLALGGLTAARIPKALAAGAAGAAVRSALWDHPDPARALAALLERLPAAEKSH